MTEQHLAWFYQLFSNHEINLLNHMTAYHDHISRYHFDEIDCLEEIIMITRKKESDYLEQRVLSLARYVYDLEARERRE